MENSKDGIFRVLKERNFFLLWVGQIVSQFGDRLAQMGLVALYLQETKDIPLPHSIPLMRNLFFFSVLPILIFSPLAGVLIDRWQRKRILIGTDFFRAGLVLLIPFLYVHTRSMAPLYLVIFLVFTATCFFTPAKSAFIPTLVKRTHLLAANSLSNLTRMVSIIGGVTLGGFIISWLGLKGGFWLDSLTFVFSGFTILAIRVKEVKPQDPVPEITYFKRVVREIWEGLRFIKGKKEISFIASSLFLLMGASGLAYVLIPVFVTKGMGMGTVELGYLAVFLGLGMLAGSLFCGQWGREIKKEKLMLGGIGGAGIIAVLLSRASSFPLLSLAVGGIGFVSSPIMIAAYTFTQEITPDRMRGRVFSALEVVINFSFLVFVWLAGVLGAGFSLPLIFLGTGTVLLLYVFFYALVHFFLSKRW